MATKTKKLNNTSAGALKLAEDYNLKPVSNPTASASTGALKLAEDYNLNTSNSAASNNSVGTKNTTASGVKPNLPTLKNKATNASANSTTGNSVRTMVDLNDATVTKPVDTPTNKDKGGGGSTIVAEIPTVETPAYTAPVQTAQATIEIPTYTAPTIDIGTAPTITEKPTFTSSAVKPTYQASTTEKPTYTSSYEKSTYTPQSYEAASYGGMGFSGRSYEGKTATFAPSQQYLEAYAEVERLLEQANSGRTSYTDKITEKLNEIENTKPFEYDFNKDPLFQNMLASYMRDGRVAMADTMGQAAALTGGYGSSYAQAVGNQAYNRMVQEGYANLPEYYQMAYQKYSDELQNKYNLLGEYRASDESEYQRMLNSFNNQFAYANDIYNKEYNKFWDETNFAEQSRQWAQNLSEQSAQHAESLSAQTSMHAQSLSEQARQWAAEMNQSEQRYADQLARADEEAAYNRYRDEISDYYRQQELDYQKYRDSMSDYYRDLGFEYDKYRDEVGDTRYADESAYERYRDLVGDARYADESAYSRYRDTVGDARYADETAYGRLRDAVSDARYADETAYNRSQDAANLALKQSANSLDWANYNLKKEAQQYEKEQAEKAAKTASYKDITDTAIKQIEKTLDASGGRPDEKFFESIADLVDKYGFDAVSRVVDNAVATKEKTYSLNMENGSLTNGFGEMTNYGLLGNPAAMKVATFTDQGNGKYYCQQTGDIVTESDLKAMYGDKYKDRIRGTY